MVSESVTQLLNLSPQATCLLGHIDTSDVSSQDLLLDLEVDVLVNLLMVKVPAHHLLHLKSLSLHLSLGERLFTGSRPCGLPPLKLCLSEQPVADAVQLEAPLNFTLCADKLFVG